MTTDAGFGNNHLDSIHSRCSSVWLQASAEADTLGENTMQQPAELADDAPAQPPAPSPEDNARAAALCKLMVDETEGLVLEALEVRRTTQHNSQLPHLDCLAICLPT